MPYRRIADADRLHALIGAILSIEADTDLPDVLRAVVSTARDLSGARYGAIGVLGERGLAEFVSVGVDEDVVERIGGVPVGRGLLGVLLRHEGPLRLTDLRDHPEHVGFPPAHPAMTSFLGVPILVAGEVYGSIYLCDKPGGVFTQGDEDTVSALAVAAALAIDKARLHGRLRELTLSEERERIARDLHETVIQRLFAVSLELQSTAPLIERSAARRRLEASVADLDETIRHIRSTVFAIGRPRRPPDASLRVEVLRVIDEVCGPFGLDARVDLEGPLDGAVGPTVAEHLLSSLREALAGAFRRAPEGKVEVDLRVDGGGLTMRVLDDGARVHEAGPAGRGSADLEERAKLLGGSCVERDRSPGPGTELVWHVARPR